MIPDLVKTFCDKGFSFFPLSPHSKIPPKGVTWTQYQTRHPTQDEIDKWAAAGSLDQLAIVCGEISGLIVLDADDLATFGAWVSECKHHLPPTPMVKTGENGAGPRCHYLYKHPGGRIKNSTKKIPGADIKADGGYIVAAGSTHPDGHKYEFFPELGLNDVDLAPCPNWILEFLEYEASSTVKVSKEDLLGPDEDDYAVLLRGVPKGGRNHAAARLAGLFLGQGQPRDRALEMLRSWNLRNAPPLTDKQLRDTVASIGRAEAKKRVKAQVAGGDFAPGGDTGLLSDDAREAVLQGVSDVLGLTISDVRAVLGGKGLWRLTINGSVIEMTGPQLTSKTSFKNAVVGALSLLPARISDKKFDSLVRALLSATVIEGQDVNSGVVEMVRELLDEFLFNHGGVEFIRPGKPVPSNSSFFILRDDPKAPPALFMRLTRLVQEAKNENYGLTRIQITGALKALKHSTSKLRRNNQEFRAWQLDLDQVPENIRVKVFKASAPDHEPDTTDTIYRHKN